MERDEFQDFPVISKELLAALDIRFPDSMPNSSELIMISLVRSPIIC